MHYFSCQWSSLAVLAASILICLQLCFLGDHGKAGMWTHCLLSLQNSVVPHLSSHSLPPPGTPLLIVDAFILWLESGLSEWFCSSLKHSFVSFWATYTRIFSPWNFLFLSPGIFASIELISFTHQFMKLSLTPPGSSSHPLFACAVPEPWPYCTAPISLCRCFYQAVVSIHGFYMPVLYRYHTVECLTHSKPTVKC